MDVVPYLWHWSTFDFIFKLNVTCWGDVSIFDLTFGVFAPFDHHYLSSLQLIKWNVKFWRDDSRFDLRFDALDHHYLSLSWSAFGRQWIQWLESTGLDIWHSTMMLDEDMMFSNDMIISSYMIIPNYMMISNHIIIPNDMLIPNQSLWWKRWNRVNYILP